MLSRNNFLSQRKRLAYHCHIHRREESVSNQGTQNHQSNSITTYFDAWAHNQEKSREMTREHEGERHTMLSSREIDKLLRSLIDNKQCKQDEEQELKQQQRKESKFFCLPL